MGNTGAQNKYITEYHLWAWPRFQGAPCHRAFVPDQWSRKLVPSSPLHGSIWHFGRNTFVFRIIFSGRLILCLLPAHLLVGLEYEAEARSDSDIGAFYQDVLSKESIFPFSTFDRPLKEIEREPSISDCSAKWVNFVYTERLLENQTLQNGKGYRKVQNQPSVNHSSCQFCPSSLLGAGETKDAGRRPYMGLHLEKPTSYSN